MGRAAKGFTNVSSKENGGGVHQKSLKWRRIKKTHLLRFHLERKKSVKMKKLKSVLKYCFNEFPVTH